jgi:hypothetical protein
MSKKGKVITENACDRARPSLAWLGLGARFQVFIAIPFDIGVIPRRKRVGAGVFSGLLPPEKAPSLNNANQT